MFFQETKEESQTDKGAADKMTPGKAKPCRFNTGRGGESDGLRTGPFAR